MSDIGTMKPSVEEQLKVASRGDLRSDFDGLLGLAETIQARLDDSKQRLEKQSLALQITFALVASVAFLAFLAFSNQTHSFAISHFSSYEIVMLISVAVIVLASVIGIVIAFLKQVQRLSNSARSDRTFLNEIVEMLREVEPVLSKKENLSMMERLQIRIRLARFEIHSVSKADTQRISRDLQKDHQELRSQVDRELTKPF
jgi:hypothetical protein